MSQRVEHLAEGVTLYSGDNREVLRGLDDCSIDSIVTDPPYALVSIQKRFGKPGSAPAKGNEAYQRASAGFMGKQWDTGEVAFDTAFWSECLRVLKPGGHVVAFSGTRTYHRMAVAIEDSGFEIRDMLSWLYGSGFPKSHDVAKNIDKAAGVEREVLERRKIAVGFDTEQQGGGGWSAGEVAITAPATDEAKQWQGWGTALKPACEPICFGRRPLIGTVAANVLQHGTGAINVDGCRTAGTEVTARAQGKDIRGGNWSGAGGRSELITGGGTGRWPANVVHDGSEEVIAAFPDAPGQQFYVGPEHGDRPSRGIYGDFGARPPNEPRNDSGSAARFFYTAKADAHDRIGSKHPTVKPIDLMQWLVRLVTPKGGIVLDPFAGTGTTAEAAFREGVHCIIIEREEEYQADIRRRVRLMMSGPEERSRESIKAKLQDKPVDAGPLFGGAA